MASITNLGKRNHLILRQVETPLAGTYVDGEWIDAVTEQVVIRANIQPAVASYQTKLLPEGDREKEAIAIYSNDWLHVSRSGCPPVAADILLYRGAHWKVVVSRPYGNYGQHCEAFAIKLDDSLTIRDTGTIGVIK